MPQEQEVAITPLENKAVSLLQYRSMSQSKKAYVEMVRQIVESEAKENENVE